MSDVCRVWVAGNLNSDFERHQRPDGLVYAQSTLCVSRTFLVEGYPQTERTLIPVEIIGAAHVNSVVQQFGFGSRVLAEGHLEAREAARGEHLAVADQSRQKTHLVLVIDLLFNAELPRVATEATQQPKARFWQEAA